MFHFRQCYMDSPGPRTNLIVVCAPKWKRSRTTFRGRPFLLTTWRVAAKGNDVADTVLLAIQKCLRADAHESATAWVPTFGDNSAHTSRALLNTEKEPTLFCDFPAGALAQTLSGGKIVPSSEPCCHMLSYTTLRGALAPRLSGDESTANRCERAPKHTCSDARARIAPSNWSRACATLYQLFRLYQVVSHVLGALRTFSLSGA